MILKEEREQVVEYGKKLVELGLTVGTFGNLSVYNPKENLMAISPSGMDYFLTKPEDVVVLTPDSTIWWPIPALMCPVSLMCSSAPMSWPRRPMTPWERTISPACWATTACWRWAAISHIR